MKNLSTIIDESRELNDLDYILESTNDFKKISTKYYIAFGKQLVVMITWTLLLMLCTGIIML